MSNELVNNPFAEFDEAADFDVPQGTIEIYKGIEGNLGHRQKDANVNRGSMANYCTRRR